ncbi:hypothetical protein BpHYR1_022074 [Brachionus plicatilis]|uniref:Uncharacterized protein n=1 Tax=Brachionus plicatilis TaxID=10195 RepID=A0A3M7QIK2_BRAPC|nr:hypothetical protein BpHYR1_022074 [Brachionus plicatilis]
MTLMELAKKNHYPEMIGKRFLTISTSEVCRSLIKFRSEILTEPINSCLEKRPNSNRVKCSVLLFNSSYVSGLLKFGEFGCDLEFDDTAKELKLLDAKFAFAFGYISTLFIVTENERISSLYRMVKCILPLDIT